MSFEFSFELSFFIKHMQEVAQLKTMKASMQVEVERLQTEASMRDSIVGNLERINNVLQFQEESIKTRLEEENKKLLRDVGSLQVRALQICASCSGNMREGESLGKNGCGSLRPKYERMRV